MNAVAWRGANGFRLMPADPLHEAPSTATTVAGAGGQELLLTYTWEHPTDGPQDGVLLVGLPGDESGATTAAWGDSWHQRPGLMTLQGRCDGGRIELAAEYGGGWGWQIEVERDDRLALTMRNVVPEEHAGPEGAAGPYPVMVAELLREAGT